MPIRPTAFVYRSRRGLLLFATLWLSLGCALAGEPEEAGIRAYLAAWDRAWAAHDAKAIASLHTDDCVTVNRVGRQLEGRAVLEQHLSRLPDWFAQRPLPPLKPRVIRFLNASTALAQSEWQNPAAPPPSTAMDNMLVTMVLVKRGEQWLATQVDLHNVTAAPPPR